MGHEITRFLREWKEGDDSAVDRLFPLVYDELRRQARSYMNKERRGHTLQPTELVNEAYMRLIDINEIDWKDRAHFFAVSSTFMRRILVDHSRRVATDKRGGGMQRLTLENLQVSEKAVASDILDLDEALKKLHEFDERKAKAIEMNYFGGLNQKEIAEVMKVSPKTIQRDLDFAKLWLVSELRGENIGND
ncbi:MAG: sigma-70 family RNA polymerase sigma factor [Pyrinomonadaceae bacterium]|nr:sigma-70 family RNA polymerase sigma factor [Pyrinomonadaceae bacterium]